ncbi:hypothetical protein KOR42_25830 [Thalassoglobus neptunius]|uniref:Uncharacterized protein n=1 Tax=Thalassoglobus neptunius TaxID=1938619 RepID=A0A5C5X0P0_9PLAN|nr:hypothetical protein KOR42_25830 [Thalassoglobus neptunius]
MFIETISHFPVDFARTRNTNLYLKKIYNFPKTQSTGVPESKILSAMGSFPPNSAIGEIDSFCLVRTFRTLQPFHSNGTKVLEFMTMWRKDGVDKRERASCILLSAFVDSPTRFRCVLARTAPSPSTLHCSTIVFLSCCEVQPQCSPFKPEHACLSSRA